MKIEALRCGLVCTEAQIIDVGPMDPHDVVIREPTEAERAQLRDGGRRAYIVLIAIDGKGVAFTEEEWERVRDTVVRLDLQQRRAFRCQNEESDDDTVH